MPRFAADSFALTILLGFLSALGPLSTDLMLPSLPSIAGYFQVPSGSAQLTLSAYLAGFALGLPFYGPISDRIGRKRVMMFGLIVFGAANAFACFAPNLETLIACRVLQGLGAAGPTVIARSIVRDLHEGRRAGQELARIGSIMGIVPLIAPVLGAGLEIAFGWRSTFAASFLLLAALAFATGRKLPETLKNALPGKVSIRAILGDFAILLVDRRFLPFAFLAAATFCGLFSFISGSSFLYQAQFGLRSEQFALFFVMVVSGFIAGSLVSQRLAMRHEAKKLLWIGAILHGLGGGSMLLATLLLPPSPWIITLPMIVFTSGVGFSLPQSMAGAMMPFPERAGSVSSLLGMLQMAFASLAGAFVGAHIEKGPLVLAGAVAFFGAITLLLQPFIVVAQKRA